MTRKYPATPDIQDGRQDDFLDFWKDELEQLSTVHILHWAVDAFYPRLALKTTFEPEGCVLLTLLSKIVPRIGVLCNEIDYQMQHFWGVTKRFYTKTGLEIVPMEHDTRLDAVLDGVRRRNRPGTRVLGADLKSGVPTVSPLVRWPYDALVQKLKQDAILDPSFVNIWRAGR